MFRRGYSGIRYPRPVRLGGRTDRAAPPRRRRRAAARRSASPAGSPPILVSTSRPHTPSSRGTGEWRGGLDASSPGALRARRDREFHSVSRTAPFPYPWISTPSRPPSLAPHPPPLPPRSPATPLVYSP